MRAGDGFRPQTGGSWFSQAMVKPGKPVCSLRDPGRTGVGHQWGYLPDVARTMVRLLGRGDPAGRRAAQRSRAGGRRLPLVAGAAARPFNESLREIREVRRFWSEPLRLDNSRLLAVLGAEPHTPLDEAIEATLVGLGCLADDPAAMAPA